MSNPGPEVGYIPSLQQVTHTVVGASLRRRVIVLAALVVTLFSFTSIVAASPAAAEGCTPSNVQLGVTKPGSEIKGYGGFFNCSGSPYATLEIQRHRWYGWQTVKSYSGNFGANSYGNIYYNCGNTGTYTYRTTMWGYLYSGKAWFKESPHMRWSC